MKAIVAFFISMFSVLGIYTDKYDQAQAAYRNGDFAQAESILEPLVREGRDDASILMAYTYLHLGKLERSEVLFQDKYAKKIGGADIAFGLALVARARQDFALAKKFGLEAATKDRTDVKEFLVNLPKPETVIPRSAFVKPAKTDAPFSARKGLFWDRNDKPIIVRGINLGIALPGKFPSEFPLEQKTYDDWLDLIGKMNANVVRIYTILPPAFYAALRAYNLKHSSQPLYVIQGVWTELPQELGFKGLTGGFTDQLLTETKRVVHAVHGRLNLPAKAGHASGSFIADVSPWVLAYVIGREWSANSVAKYNSEPGSQKSFKGKYLETAIPSAFEAWLAGILDSMIGFEMDEYNAQRPMAFTNWPSTDPLPKITKTNTDVDHVKTTGSLDLKAIGIDAKHLHATKAFPTGTFASYHAYPSFRDISESVPSDARTARNRRSNYFDYLKELKQHHGEMPVLISAVGVASARGSVENPSLGGLSETDQALQNLKLYDEVLESGMAGGIMFSWLDKWFKHNRPENGFDLSDERSRLWHSPMDSNQNYGILAAEPKDQPRLGSSHDRWKTVPTLNDGLLQVRALADPEYLHLLIKTPLKTADRLEFAIDTHPMGGANLDWTGQNKPEFHGTLEASRGSIQILSSYLPVKRPVSERSDLNPPLGAENQGMFVPIQTGFSGSPKGPDGLQTSGKRLDVGILNPGSDPIAGHNPTIDYHWDPNGVQIRLPWTLIMVSDPSSRNVYDGSTKSGSRQIADIGLNVRLGNLSASPMRFSWTTWDERPAFELRLKPVYQALQKRWSTLK
jgi:hypothetical protein